MSYVGFEWKQIKISLKIQDDTLTGTQSSVDISTKENLEELVHIGESLLKKPVSRVNLETGQAQPIQNGGTNEEALIKYGTINVLNMQVCTHFFVLL